MAVVNEMATGCFDRAVFSYEWKDALWNSASAVIGRSPRSEWDDTHRPFLTSVFYLAPLSALRAGATPL